MSFGDIASYGVPIGLGIFALAGSFSSRFLNRLAKQPGNVRKRLIVLRISGAVMLGLVALSLLT